MVSTNVAPVATINDFLNNIGPTQSTITQKLTESSSTPVKAKSDGMDVDEMPSLRGTWPSEELNTPVVEPVLASALTGALSRSTPPSNVPNSIGVGS